jgi:hypothetical protein
MVLILTVSCFTRTSRLADKAQRPAERFEPSSNSQLLTIDWPGFLLDISMQHRLSLVRVQTTKITMYR